MSIEIKIDKIPKFLRDIKGWAGFIVEDGKKKPISLVDMKGIGANDFDRLVDFDTACAAVSKKKIDFLGVSLMGQEITCIDLDCHSEDNRDRYEEVKKELLDLFKGTYSETSISGVGTHIFVKGKIPEGYKHTDKYGVVEIYSGTRFMVATGHQIEGSADYIGICQEQLTSTCEKYLMKKEGFKGVVGKGAYTKTDEEVIEKVREFKKGKLFLEGRWAEIKKWDEQVGAYIPSFTSQSNADFSFAGLLLYLNGNNPEQALRLFRGTKMWDEKREKKKSSGYLETTFQNASLRCTKVYDWEKNYTEKEKSIDFDEVMAQMQNAELVKVAAEGPILLTGNKELDEYLRKYIINFGAVKREFIPTSHGDFDSAANGLRFFLVNKQNLFYQAESDEWLAWNGRFWDRVYDKNLLSYAEVVFNHIKMEAYSIFLKSISDEDNRIVLEEQSLTMFKYASTNKGRKECLEMVDFSKDHFTKYQLETGLNKKVKDTMNVLNLKNGIFNFDNMEFVPHAREYFQTKISETSYQANVQCPLWSDFMDTALPDPEVRRYFQKVVGYIISGLHGEKSIFILTGSQGNNGKTTISKTLYKLLGEYAVAAEKQTIMASRIQNAGAPRPDLVRLRDRRLVSISESEKDDKLAEGLVKNLTGGGVIICRTLHHEPVEFYPNFKIIVDTNHDIKTSGTDPALFRRLKIIPFNHVIPPEQIDLNFGEKLEKELSGILNWGIEGYQMYQSEGLELPDCLKALVQEYAESMTPLDSWLQECVDYFPNGGQCPTSKQLFYSYQQWCQFNHEYCLGQRRFTQEINLKEWFFNTKKVKGYIKYTDVHLNDVGELFTKEYVDTSEFRKKYDAAVNRRFMVSAPEKEKDIPAEVPGLEPLSDENREKLKNMIFEITLQK